MKPKIFIMLAALWCAGCVPALGDSSTNALVIREFSFPWSDRPAPRTECRLEVRGDRLHFAFDVEDREVVVQDPWRGESTVDAEDRVEIFFARDEGLSRYWCVEIDPLGRVHDYAASHYRKFDDAWNCAGLKTSARRTPKGYQVEGSFPLDTLSSVLGHPVAAGSDVRLGLFRAEFYGRDVRTQGDAPDNWLSWVRPASAQPDFHVPSAFQPVRLPSMSGNAADGSAPGGSAMARNHQPGAGVFRDWDTLARGAHQVRLLPGVGEFVFSLYGAPGDLATVRQLVGVLRECGLANGFDPGPGPGAQARPVFDFLASNRWPVVFYSGGDMQIKGGRAIFGPAQESALVSLDRAGIFTAYQLGEWGYYFHNLSHQESWWRDVYGKDFDAFKHLKKPAGLAGYDRRPAGKKECYEVVKDYFLSRSRDLLGRVISVTGHSHYEAYAGEWGARCIGLEVGENIAFTQSKLVFARGAARQWGKPWSVQVSPWFGPSCTTSGPLRTEGGIVRGLDAGHSLSFYERMWLHAWFSGAAMVTPENSIAIFFEKAEAPWPLTEHGRKAAAVFQFMRGHPRGVPYTPVAIVLDRFAGYNGYMDKPWGILSPTAGDREARDLFDHQLYPGSDHIHTQPDPANPEASYLRPTPFGELADVLLTSVPPEILPAYPVILLVGDIEFDLAFLSELEKSLRRGSRVLMSARHRDALGGEFARVAGQGTVEVLEPWTNPATGRPAAIANDRLHALARSYLPVQVEGDPIHYAVNRTASGWVVELINHRGVSKRGNQPAVVDPKGGVRVVLKARGTFTQAKSWRSGQVHAPSTRLELELGPGAAEYVEFVQ